MSKNTIRYSFIATTVIVAFLKIWWSHNESRQWILNELFIWGFLGLAVINILLFVIPMCIGIFTLRKNSVKSESQKRQGEKNEKKLTSLLKGDTISHRGMPSWAKIGIAVCIGLIVGSILGFIVNKNISMGN
jgi:hypothetical protein